MKLIPAYSRDYKSERAVRQDWEDGKDFQISDISSKWNGSYTSKKDNHNSVSIRYAHLTKIIVID